MVHGVSNGTSTLEEVGSGVALLVEALMVATAGLREADTQLRAVDCREV